MTDKPKIVILGSGYAGGACAKQLQSSLGGKIDLTVVDKRKANIHKIAAARAAVLGKNYCERVLIPNDKLVKPANGIVINSTIEEVTDKEVILEGGKTLPFDYLVCATGAINFSVVEPPLKIVEKAKMVEFYAKVHDMIKVSKKVVIVGGGPTGLELAGEIKFEYPKKAVTIVHSREVLMNKLSPNPKPKFEKRVVHNLEKKEINLIKGERIQVDFGKGNMPFIYKPEAKYMTDKGTEIEADLVLLCAGKKESNSVYPSEWLSEAGQIKVRPTLQLEKHENIYAIGDINDVDENKQAAFCPLQAGKCASNIAHQIKAKGKLEKYTPGFGTGKTFIFVTCGRKLGAAWMGYVMLGSLTTGKLKGKHLFCDKYWGIYGHKKAPKEINGPSSGGKTASDEQNQAETFELDEYFE